jgi:hypothetical protein
VGGVTDIATDGVDALLVPPRDPVALGQAILMLMQDEPLRNRLASAGASRVRNAFSLNACIDAYAHLYDLMLEQPSLPSDEIVRRYRAARPSMSGDAMPAPHRWRADWMRPAVHDKRCGC